MTIGDLDGDGKPDLAVANLGGGSGTTVSVFLNTSTSGTVSFAAKTDFTTGTGPAGASIGDLDGDGKPDLAVVNSVSNTVSVFRNTSSSGTVSFAGKVDFNTGSGPDNVAIGDVDGDGKPDLVVTNRNSNTVSVFRSTSSSGTVSFAGKVDFATGTGPLAVAVGDVDGDGKPDLAVTNWGSGSGTTVSVFRNTSTPGTVSCDAKVDFTTGTSPVGVSIGDVDGDGKLDLSVVNNGSDAVSVLRNTSSSGTVSLEAKVDFTTGGGPQYMSIGDVDGDGKPDLSVANFTSNTVSVLRNTSSSGTVTLAGKVDFTTGTGPRIVALGDLDGDGKPDLAVANVTSTTISVFRNQTLTAPLPTITSFTPTSANVGASVTITGTNFDATANNNTVFFGATKATVTAASTTSLTVTVPTGPTFGPLSVTVANRTALSRQFFLPTFSGTGSAIDAPSLAAKVDFATTGSQPFNVAISDLDGDGKPDLAVTNWNSAFVSVYRNVSTSGTIDASSFPAKQDFATGSNPNGVVIGDLDGDGKPELAVTNYGSATVSVFRNTATSGSITSGSFAAKVDYTTGTEPYSMAIGDLDRDGKPDLAVANMTSSTVSVFRNTSISGTIDASSFAAKVDFTAGTNPQSVAIGDLDGDGKPDLAVTAHDNSGSGTTVSVFRNTSTSGVISSGSFAAKVDFNAGANPQTVAIGDLDGDGKFDLVVTNDGLGSGTTISVFRNTSTSGVIDSGSFAAKVDYTTGSGPRSVAIGDVDGDAKPDLAVANKTSNTLSVFRNTSTSGTIDGSSFATKVDFSTGTNPNGLAIGDLDGDGKADLVATDINATTISVLRNLTPIPTITSFTPTSANVGASVTITGTNFSTTTGNNRVYFGATKATVTAATTTSLTVTVPVGATFGPISVTVANQTVISKQFFLPTFVATVRGIDPTTLAAKVDFTAGTGPAWVAFGDLDGDGKPDMAVTNATANTVSVYRNTSAAGTVDASSFGGKVDFATGTTPREVAIGDVDGDGKPDLVVANANVGTNTVSVLRNTSTSGTIDGSSFAGKVDYTTAAGAYGVGIGDLDGDGKLDLTVAANGANKVSVLRNTSLPGTIDGASFAAKVDFTTAANPRSVAIGDVDGDGKTDVTVAANGADVLSVLRNTGTPGAIDASSLAAKVDFATGTGPLYVAIGDVDGDGKLDLAAANFGAAGSGTTVSVFRNTSTSGTVSLAAKQDFATGTGPRSVAIGDVDGDGKPELVATNDGSNTVSVFRNTSTSGTIDASSLAAKEDFTTGSNPYSVAIGDVDGDQKPELLVADNVGAKVSVLRNQTYTAALPTITSFTPTSANVGASVTITGTNFSATTGNNTVFFGATKATVTAASTTSLTVTVPAGATFGPLSVVVANRTAISSQFFLPTFAATVREIAPTTLATHVDFTAGTGARAIAKGDLDGDGKADVAVANYTSGTVSVYLNTCSLGSVTFATKVDLTTGSNPTDVEIGDVDGDGKPDLVVPASGAALVSVFRNTGTSGSISFSARADFSTATGSQSVAIVDLDGDGRPELAVANPGATSLSVLRNTSSPGSIGFAAKVDFTTGTTPASVTAGDIDGDGKPDLAVTDSGANTVSVFRNTSTPGTISSSSLAARVSFATATQTADGEVALGDMDGDGKLDVVVSCFTDDVVSVLRNTSTSGTVSFAAKADFATANGPTGVSVGDVDGDGKPEIAVDDDIDWSVSLLRNTSTSGTINSSSFATQVYFTAGQNPFGVVIADLDGDGKPEVATANFNSANFSVLRNQTYTAALPTITSFTPTSAAVGASVTITGTNFSTTTGNNTVFFGATKATVTAATATSLTATVPTGATFGPVSVTIGDRAAFSKLIFVPTFAATVPSIDASNFAAAVNFSDADGPYNLALGDVDGDGKADLIVANYGSNNLSVYRNTSTTGVINGSTLAAKVDFTTGTGPVWVDVGDLDFDGKLDLVVANFGGTSVSIFRNTSTGSGSVSFAAKSDYATTYGPRAVAIGDLDLDGKLDIAAANDNASGVISVFRNVCPVGGANAANAFVAKVDFGVGGNPYSLGIRDLDGDNKPELIAGNRTGNNISVLRNTSTPGEINGSSFAAKFDFTTGTAPIQLAIGDVDGDGKLDLVSANSTTNNVSVLRNLITSPGAFGGGSFAAKVDFSTTAGPNTITIADLDGDGKPDLATGNYNSATGNTLSVLRNNSTSGTVALAPSIDLTAGSGPYGLAAGDLDGDGKPELIVANSGATTISVFRNQTLTTPLPTITSFTPTSAAAGASVTITGTNFSATPANNTVFFGATKATVTAASTTSLTVTVPAGATFGPLSVAVANRTAVSKQFFLPTFAGTDYHISSATLAAKVDFATGSGPYEVAMGDLDGDSKPDIVVTNGTSNTVSVFRNTSTSGTVDASSFAAKVDFTTGTFPIGAAIRDLDGDGKPDIVVTNFTSNTVSVFRNTSSSGTVSFAGKVDFTTGTSPQNGAIGDVDGDGKPDLVVANNGSNTVSVLRNTSTLGVVDASSFAAKVDFTTEAVPLGVAVGDVDGDGKPDLAVTNHGASASGTTMSVFRNTSTLGTVSLAAKIDYTTGTGPAGVSIGDVDGDGKLDIAVGNYSSNAMSVFRNTSSSGTVTFAGRVDFTTGTGPQYMSIGDVDGDGKPDIAVGNITANTMSVFRNTSSSGTVTFAGKVDFTAGTGATYLATGDVDGDGKPDLVVANTSSSTVSVFRNQTLTTPLPTITSISPTSAAPGASVTITGTNFSTTPANNTVFFDPIKATVTAATTTSLTLTVPNGAGYGPISATVANRTAISKQFFLPTFSAAGQGIGSNSLAAKVDFSAGTNPAQVAVGDLDGDGKADLAAANSGTTTVSLFRNTSTSGTISGGSFATAVDFTAGTTARSLAIGDVDGDGKLELVAANQGSNTVSVFRNTSTSGVLNSGSFAAKVDFATGTGPVNMAVGDMDGDGRLDLVVPNYSSNTVSVFRNTSSAGTIDASSFATKVDFATGTAPHTVAVGDLDGDGKAEIALTNESANTVSVFRNTSSAGAIDASSFAAKVDFATGTNPRSVVIGDVDGDGKLELAVANVVSNTVSVFRNTSSSGAIDSGSLAAKLDFTTGSAPGGVAMGDLDGDSKAELVVANETSTTVSVFRNTSTSGAISSTSLAAKADFATSATPQGVAIGDLDGDGKPDLVVTNAGANTLSVLRNQDPLFIEVGTTAGVDDGGQGEGAAWADYDNDGDQDLYVVNYGSANRLYRNNGSGSFAEVGATAGVDDAGSGDGTAWGDYDNDGDLDLYLANNGANRLYRNNNNGAFSEVGSSAGVADPGYGQGVAWADYDRDGDLDLYAVNYGSANRLYRNNNNGTFAEVGAAAGVAASGNGYSPAWGDYDNDGDPDLYVTNNGANRLYRNNNDGTFAEVGVGAGVADPGYSTGASWGDYDNDGDLDLYLGTYGAANSLYRNNNNGTFAEVGASAGVGDSGSGYGVAWADYDNDGDLDLYLVNYGSANRLYRNNNNGTFTEVGEGAGVNDGGNGVGVAWADYDNDGDVDLYLVNQGTNRLYRNNGNANRWLQVKLSGVNSNKSGIGAKVSATASGITQRRDVEGGGGFLSQSSLPVEFGFGGTTTISQLTITWPFGVVQTLANVATNQVLTLSDAITPTQLVFTTQPGGAVHGQSLGVQPVVEARDASGQKALGYAGTVTLAAGSGGTLSGSLTAVAVDGVASFSGAVFSGAGTRTLIASAAGLSSATSAPIAVAKAPASITFISLTAAFNGQPQVVGVTTNPPGLPVGVGYNGSGSPPVAPGVYAAVATIADPNYAGSASANFTIFAPPVAKLNASVIQGNPPLEVNFTDGSSGAIDAWYLETFDSGGRTSENRGGGIKAVYDRPGTYEAVLTVRGPGGQSVSRVRVTVLRPPQVGAINAPSALEDAVLELNLAGLDPEPGGWSVRGVDAALVAKLRCRATGSASPRCPMPLEPMRWRSCAPAFRDW